ncbi:MAG: tyrosine-type recombinase/integrase [Clostridiaceae bacterium]
MAVKTNCVKNGSKYYRTTATVGRDIDGKPIRKEFYGTCKSDSEAKKEEYLDGLKKGLNSEFMNIVSGVMFHSWLYEVVRLKVKPSSFEKYNGLYENYIKASDIYGAKLYDIKSIQLQRLYNSLYDKGIGSKVIKDVNILLRAFFNYAMDEGYILSNPCKGSKVVIPGLNEMEDVEVEVFLDEEINRLKNFLNTHRLKCLILMALGTGLRQGELLALQWNDINFEHKTVNVDKSIKRVKIFEADGTSIYKMIVQTPKSKNGKRTVPFPSAMIPIIEGHRILQANEKAKLWAGDVNSNYVFTTLIGTPINSRNLFKSYKSILSNAKVPHKKFHALRHTYATKLFMADVPLKTVSELLGHANIAMTADIYTHVLPKQKNHAAEKLNDIFL